MENSLVKTDTKLVKVIEPCQHRIINIGDYQTLYFSIDFEPVELRMSEEFKLAMGGHFTLREWQDVIDFCCEVLGKEPHEVCALKENDWHGNAIPETFDKYCYEFIDTSAGPSWMYFIRTKTYYFRNFYQWFDLIHNKERPYKHNPTYDEFSIHFDGVAKYLKQQGLIRGRDYHEPSLDLIERFTKKFLNLKN